MTNNPNVPLPKNWAARFFTIWGGQVFSLFGSGLVQFALVWYLTKESGSATVLAMATLMAMLPQILFSPIAGALVDRWNRRWVMILADGSIALATLVLVYLFAAGKVQIWHIYAILFLRGFGGIFHWLAMQSSTSLMVPERHLSRVAGMNQTLQGIINIIAPPSGAFLIEYLTTHQVLLIDVGTAAIAIFPLFFIPIPQPLHADDGDSMKPAFSRFWEDLTAGFRYVAAWKGLLGILVIASAINFLLNPTASMMPLLVTQHFHLGAMEFGLMDSAWGFGVIAGGIFLSIWGGFRRKILTSIMGIIGIGMGTLLVGAAPANLYSLALVGMVLDGVMKPMANGPLMAILQSVVPPEMQGRVMSLITSAAGAMSPLGLLIAGPVSDLLGVRAWFWIAGAGSLLLGVSAFFVPAILNVENNHADAGALAK